MAKTANKKERWMDFNEANLKKYIREKNPRRKNIRQQNHSCSFSTIIKNVSYYTI